MSTPETQESTEVVQMAEAEPSAAFVVGPRLAYLIDFVELTASDVEAIHGSASVIRPLLPSILDDAYVKLLDTPATRAIFDRRYGHLNPTTGQTELPLEEDGMFRHKDFLSKYLINILSGSYHTGEVFDYMETVGFAHAGKSVDRIDI
ncbi:hypothetical protein BCV70DRAFT_7708 [Testicularia cyperi]|uniref:Globin-sensor domain-containing protein n=1 Tax=Testicularia cyperi TaxID=1882483 RepID=A0A317XZT2_9BASI|nr:hypothetical protein BCV70DRAFT_7708 [Testicularia cyperi]